MASQTRTKTWSVQNPNTQQATNVPPVAVPFVTVSVSEIIINTPSAPGPL